MQIEFTKDQYFDLLKLIHCWNFLVNSPRETKDKIQKMDDLASYIYSQARDFWYWDYVKYQKVEDLYVANNKLEEDSEVEEYIEDYNKNTDDEMFWEELIHTLAERDLEEKNIEITQENLEKVVNFYDQEFVKNWVQNLRIVD